MELLADGGEPVRQEPAALLRRHPRLSGLAGLRRRPRAEQAGSVPAWRSTTPGGHRQPAAAAARWRRSGAAQHQGRGGAWRCRRVAEVPRRVTSRSVVGSRPKPVTRPLTTLTTSPPPMATEYERYRRPCRRYGPTGSPARAVLSWHHIAITHAPPPRSTSAHVRLRCRSGQGTGTAPLDRPGSPLRQGACTPVSGPHRAPGGSDRGNGSNGSRHLSGHRPWYTGGRFSRKDATPSRWSSVRNSSARLADTHAPSSRQSGSRARRRPAFSRCTASGGLAAMRRAERHAPRAAGRRGARRG